MPDVSVEEFTEEVTAFFNGNAKLKMAEEKPFVWGEGDDDMSSALFEDIDRDKEKLELREAQEWRAKRYDAGLGWITGPKEYGGRELTSAHERAYSSIEGRYDIPDQSFFGIGLGMVAPTILAHAQPHIRDRYLAKMYRGDIVGCQLFSEPGAGSDLAGLQTRAVRDGDEWIVTGQKVWTSGAQYSDIGEIICRTDPEAPKHKGLTGFVIDMHAPGVEVRPLRQMTGGASFNEVFFNEVRIPDDHRLGDVNQGWTVALTTLMNERASIGGGGAGVGSFGGERLIGLMRYLGKDKDALVRQEFANLYVHEQVARMTNLRAMEKIKAGQLPGPEMSIGKLALTRNMQRTAEFVAHVLGPRMTADSGEWGTYAWSEFVLGIPGMRIAGGTDEVMKNILGERVLGLPKEPPVEARK